MINLKFDTDIFLNSLGAVVGSPEHMIADGFLVINNRWFKVTKLSKIINAKLKPNVQKVNHLTQSSPDLGVVLGEPLMGI